MFFPLDVEKEARDMGVTLDEFPFEEIRGCVCRSKEAYHIGIAETLDPIKKRMTIAHELAHIEDDTIDGVHVFIAERRASKIAREKLVPENFLKGLIADGVTDSYTLGLIFNVSPKMIALRCNELGY